MAALVSYQLSNSIATISMDDGKANALSPKMLSELNGALDQATTDRAVVILTGRPGMFSAGFDLTVLSAGGENAYNMLIGGFRLAERLLSFPKPVIIACNGHAIAMGVFLVQSVDYRIGTEGNFKIGANEVAIGLTLPHAAVEICRQRLLPAHFDRAMNLSEFYTPVDAVAAGFLDRVVAESDLHAEAQATAAKLAKLNMPAHLATKLRVREQTLKGVQAGIEADEVELRALVRHPPKG